MTISLQNQNTKIAGVSFDVSSVVGIHLTASAIHIAEGSIHYGCFPFALCSGSLI